MRPLLSSARLWRPHRALGRSTSASFRSISSQRDSFTRFLDHQARSQVPGKLTYIPNTPRFDSALNYAALLNESIGTSLNSLSIFDQNWVTIVEKLQARVEDSSLHDEHLRSIHEATHAPKWISRSATLETLDPQHAIVRLVATLLISARETAKLDLLRELGVESNRWDLVAWLVRVLTEKQPTNSSTFSSALYSQVPDLKFTDFTDTWPPFSLSTDQISKILKSTQVSEENDQPTRSLSSIYDTYDSDEMDGIDSDLHHSAIGVVLWSLGRLVLTARNANQPTTSDKFMNHILDILSILHHNNIIPRHTYLFDESFDQGVRQTPILAELYQPLLFAILDAEWNTFQSDTPEAAKYESIASVPIPNFQFPVHDSNPSNLLSGCHEVWFELLLWIMLRGGWHAEGSNLLLEARLNNWTSLPSSSMCSKTDGKRVWNIPSRAVSSELVACYVDNMACCIDQEWSRSSIQGMREMLKSEENLKFSTWDNLVVRIFSQHNHHFEEDELNMRRVLSLAEPNVGDESTSSELPSDSYLAYSSNPLNGLMHQILWMDLHLSDILAAVETFLAIRSNKRDASEFQFQGSNKIPEHTLTALIDAIIALDPITLGPRLLFPSQELSSVPLMETSDYSKPLVAKSLIRYATIIKDDKLLRDVLRENRRVDMDHHPLVSIALMEAQIENQRWRSAENTIVSLSNSRNLRRDAWVGIAIANLAKALIKLRSSKEFLSDLEREAKNHNVFACSQILRRVVEQTVKYADLKQHAQAEEKDLAHEIRSLLGVLATIDDGWLAFCRPHITSLRSQPLILKESTFLIVLEAVADYEGFPAAWKLFTRWCQDINQILGTPQLVEQAQMELIENDEVLPPLDDTQQLDEENAENAIVTEAKAEVEIEEQSPVPEEIVTPWTKSRRDVESGHVPNHFSLSNWVRVDLADGNGELDLGKDSNSRYTISFRGRIPASLMIIRSMLVRAPDQNMDPETAKAVQSLLAVMKWKTEGREHGEQAWKREMELIRTIKMLRSA